MKGFIVKFDPERGFGFIRVPHRKEDIFVHISDIENRMELETGRWVTFNVEETQKGPCAKQVKPGAMRKSPLVFFLNAGGILFLTVCFLLRFRFSISWPLAYLAGINCATMVLYGYDKLIAGSQLLRVPERVLHIFTFAGGTPAALLSQRLFRHKTIKESFRTQFWMIVFLQVCLFLLWIWLSSR